MNAIKKQLLLFWDFFKIGLFTFGGGYAMISVISNELVDRRKYVSREEFSDLVAIAESTPGPIAINSATYIGYKVGGILGAIISSIAVSLPSFIIIYLISKFFVGFLDYEIVVKAFKGIQCAVVILIISAAFKLFKEVKKNFLSYFLIALSATLLLIFDILSIDVSTIYFLLVGGMVGFAYYYPKLKRQGEKKEEENAKKPANSAVTEQNESTEDKTVTQQNEMAEDEKEPSAEDGGDEQ